MIIDTDVQGIQGEDDILFRFQGVQDGYSNNLVRFFFLLPPNTDINMGHKNKLGSSAGVWKWRKGRSACGSMLCLTQQNRVITTSTQTVGTAGEDLPSPHTHTRMQTHAPTYLWPDMLFRETRPKLPHYYNITVVWKATEVTWWPFSFFFFVMPHRCWILKSYWPNWIAVP